MNEGKSIRSNALLASTALCLLSVCVPGIAHAQSSSTGSSGAAPGVGVDASTPTAPTTAAPTPPKTGNAPDADNGEIIVTA